MTRDFDVLNLVYYGGTTANRQNFRKNLLAYRSNKRFNFLRISISELLASRYMPAEVPNYFRREYLEKTIQYNITKSIQINNIKKLDYLTRRAKLLVINEHKKN